MVRGLPVNQSVFTKKGRIAYQLTLKGFLDPSKSFVQTSIDDWFFKNKGQALTTVDVDGQNRKYGEFLDDWDETISCIELTMRHDRFGNVLGWMEGEPKSEGWDGSIDNSMGALEKHVSKLGWLF